MMNPIRRWLIIPILIVFSGAVLFLMGKISIDSTLPLDYIVPVVAALAGLALVVLLGIEAQGLSESWDLPEPEEPPTSNKVIYPKPLTKAEEAMEKAEKFSSTKTEKVRIEIDIEDARDD